MQNMNGLKMLCNGRPPKGFLQNKEMLNVENCPKIVSLYPVAQNLKALIVEECEKLEEVFRIDEFHYNREENQASLLLSKLVFLKIDSVPELRWIIKGPTQYVGLGKLQNVRIEKCNSLESLFSFSLIPSLTLLEKLRIIDCDKLETVFGDLESDGETESNKLLASAQELPRLEVLKLCGLRKLRSFGPQNYLINAPALEEFEVADCPLFSNFTDKPLQSKAPRLEDQEETQLEEEESRQEEQAESQLQEEEIRLEEQEETQLEEEECRLEEEAENQVEEEESTTDWSSEQSDDTSEVSI
ncbi:hypothetical protein DITRI_Ditri02bG0172500 [Diplodiscus trichospermus]